MEDEKEYPITIHLSKETGIPPIDVDFYFESYPNAIVGYRGTTPYRFAYTDVVLIVGPETPPDILESMRRLETIQKYEYCLTIDRRALEFASYIEHKHAPTEPIVEDPAPYNYHG